MPVILPSLLLTIVVGLAIASQTQFAGILGQHVGIMESVFIIHLGGLLIAGMYLLVVGGGNLSAWKTAPWYLLCGGALGVMIVGGYAFVIPRIGLAPAITIAVASQLIFSALLSHYGILGAIQQPLTLSRIAGVLVLLVGTWLIVR